MLYEACVKSRLPKQRQTKFHEDSPLSYNRCQRVLLCKDTKALWNSVNWKGFFDKPADLSMKHSDEEFCQHFSELLNSSATEYNYIIAPSSNVYIPLLDNEILPGEVVDQIETLKPQKSAGIDGIAPGVLKLLPDDWIVLITLIMNIGFFGVYPAAWTIAKVFVLFKKVIYLTLEIIAALAY